MYSEDAMELRLTWEEAQGWLEIFEDHDARNLLPATLETLLETIKSQMLSGSSIVIWGLRTEFEEIISTLNLIKAVAKDIEEKQSRSKAVELCLQMVKDAAYDADDVLDEITIKAQPEHKLSSMSRASSILSPFGSNKELKSMKIEGRLDHIAWQKDPFSIREQVGDREEVSSDTQTSSLVEKLQFHGKDNQEEESLLEISEKEMLVDGGEGSSEATEWTLLMTNLLLECMSAILDQLGYPLPGMVTAFVALVLSTIDLFLVAQKEKITWDGGSLLPCFHFHSTQ